MATRVPTFLGEQLSEGMEICGKPLFRNEIVEVYWITSARTWVARLQIEGLVVGMRGATKQKALDKCEAKALDMFREISAKLGYEVEG